MGFRALMLIRDSHFRHLRAQNKNIAVDPHSTEDLKHGQDPTFSSRH